MDSAKYKNKYRVASARLQSWDYGWNGAYFITICTKNRLCCFGDVIDKKMQLSNIGVIADVLWYEIKNHSKNIKLGEFVVMPNHVHGILVINKPSVIDPGMVDTGVTDIRTADTGTGDTRTVETLHATSLRQYGPSQYGPPQPPGYDQKMASISPKSNSISTIVRSYKSAVSKHGHRLGYEFFWQSRFHDHIIRTEKSFNQISEYINTNPQKWPDDKFYAERD